jgi:hypothetical protein
MAASVSQSSGAVLAPLLLLKQLDKILDVPEAIGDASRYRGRHA